VAAQARRLLTSRGRGHAAALRGQWLNVDQLATVPKDQTVFPEFTAAIRAEMAEEAARYVAYVTFDGAGTYQELLLGATASTTPSWRSSTGRRRPRRWTAAATARPI